MKKLPFVFSLLMLISGVVFAGIENPAPVSGIAILKSGDIVKVLYKGQKPSKVSVVILDEKNHVVFSESVNKRADFVRPYNLSNLPEGDYKIVVEDENGKREDNIRHGKENSKVLSSIIHAREKQKCAVTLFSKVEAQVKITITDSQKNLLASDSFSVNGQSSRLFNLENVKGPLFVEVTDENGTVRSSTIQ
jgi:hypothetical protein